VLRTAFWSLLFLNAALFAYNQGYLGSARSAEHEPERLKRQFNTAKLTVLAREGAGTRTPAAPAAAPAQDAPRPMRAASKPVSRRSTSASASRASPSPART
jgi:hypothetical protein